MEDGCSECHKLRGILDRIFESIIEQGNDMVTSRICKDYHIKV